jgi:phospholipid/cholesterol/gamma-HCH transport system substrate-binding protein
MSRSFSAAQRVAPSLLKLGAFVVATVAAFSVLALTIVDARFGPKAEYTALFTDATGLAKGDDVRVAGVRVGEVSGIAAVADENAGALAEVRLRIDREVVLTQGTTVRIRYRNLIGQRYVALTQERGAARELPLGATIGPDRTRPALDLTALFNGFKPLFTALDPAEVNKLAYEVITVLQGEGGTIEHLLASTASLTSELADRDAVIGRTIDTLNQVLASVSERAGQLDELIVQLHRFVAGLAEDRAAIGASLTNIADLADSTAGLVEDVRPPLRADVQGLGGLATVLDRNSATIESFFDTWPGKLETLTRTASYGSWFNFYLCSFDGTVVVPVAGTTTSTPVAYEPKTARCRP